MNFKQTGASKCQPDALFSDCNEYKIVTFDIPSAPCNIKLGVKKCHAAYKRTYTGQFGNHVDRSKPFYKTLKEAIKACKTHKAA